LEFDAEQFVQVLKVHGRGLSMANHIIRQDEDKAKVLLYAIRFGLQEADRWRFAGSGCLRKDLG
jgi:hypothetical protein